MAITELGRILQWPRLVPINPSGQWRVGTNVTLNQLNYKVSINFRWPYAATSINEALFKVGAVAGSGTLTGQMYTSDISAWPVRPSVTTVGGSATWNWISSDDNSVVTMDHSGDAPSLTPGTYYSYEIEATTVDTAGQGPAYAMPDRGVDLIGAEYGSVVVSRDIGAGWANASVVDWAQLALRDSGGTVLEIPGLPLPGADGNAEGSGEDDAFGRILYSTSSTNDEYGITITPAVGLQSIGVWCSGDFEADFTAKLYSDPTGTPSAERTVTFDEIADRMHTANRTCVFLPWATPFELTASTKYAVTMLATTSTNIEIAVGNVDAAGDVSGYACGQNVKLCKRDGSSGAFTEVNAYNPCIALAVNGIETGGGGGTSSVLGGGSLSGGFS